MTTMEMQWSEAKRVFDCPSCGAQTFPEWLWGSMSKEERIRSGGRRSLGDKCLRCARNPELAEPLPGAELIEPECTGCGKTMVTRVHWRKASYAERDELKDEGYVVASNDEWCRACRPKDAS